MKLLILITFAISFTLSLYGYEVDQFTDRGKPLSDSTKALDKLILNKLTTALQDANSGFLSTNLGTTSCDGTEQNQRDSRFKLFEALRDYLVTQSPIGIIEDFANSNKNISKRIININDSIYSTAKDHSIILKKFGLSPVIKINSIEIGTDKLGHFFDEGYGLYLSSYKMETKVSKLGTDLLSEKSLEQGSLGITTTNIKSYGDMAANYDGTQFWNRLCGWATLDSSLEEKEYFKKNKCLPNAYIKCEQGKWKFNESQKFSIADYVTSAWDEAINCSSYTEEISDLVFTELSKKVYQYKGNPKQPCPAEPQKCLEIENKYSKKVFKIITNPICRNIAKKIKSNETVDSTTKFDYTYKNTSDYKPTQSNKPTIKELREKVSTKK
ncbi:MAG: hypothetical protein WA160_10240 [Pseudobdellovibrio sp.]